MRRHGCVQIQLSACNKPPPTGCSSLSCIHWHVVVICEVTVVVADSAHDVCLLYVPAGRAMGIGAGAGIARCTI